MGSYTFFSSILYFFLLATLVTSSSYISNDIFNSGASTGRSLLQAKKACTVDFESKNFTILTSQCKGPQYRPKICCDALKQFACPFVDNINDLTTNCAEVMFSYINLYGKYPPGLFANECKEGELGLECSDVNNSTSSSVLVPAPNSMVMVSFVGFIGFIFHLF
ncbi:GPI-anchored protein LLG3-like [Vicia villosa]|uniref:GPI-anchored protein LLG3-like n=1 Tax=Vicia villosa TaxID=3911 RepID=UPI00273CE4F5|nr:GPI-anchored protein LLG3-like [Vicia villosa]